VLESMIDDYLEKRTLARDDDFRSFRNEFENESAAFIYISTPVLFNSMKTLADMSTRASMENNKDFIVCFRHAGFQLVPNKEGFKTLFAEKFVEPVSKQMAGKPSLTLQGSIELDSAATKSGADEIVEDIEAVPSNTDPMELPYIYVKNVNAKFYEEFFADSTTYFKVDLKGGFKDGSFKEYYPTGKVKMTGQFKRDKRDGTWRLYDETGKQLMRRNYNEGKVTKEKVKD